MEQTARWTLLFESEIIIIISLDWLTDRKKKATPWHFLHVPFFQTLEGNKWAEEKRFKKKRTWKRLAAGMSLRAAEARDFPHLLWVWSPATINWKIEPKEIPGCLIPRPLVVFTQQLESLETTLFAGFAGWASFTHKPSNMPEKILLSVTALFLWSSYL